MGWHYLCFARTRSVFLIAFFVTSLALAGAFLPARAQTYTTIRNGYLELGVGVSADVGGYISLSRVTTNLLGAEPVIAYPPAPTANNIVSGFGSRIFIRVDGGITNSFGGTGWDFVFGDQTTGFWVTPPSVVGNHL